MQRLVLSLMQALNFFFSKKNNFIQVVSKNIRCRCRDSLFWLFLVLISLENWTNTFSLPTSKEWQKLDGRFTMSDDSHGIAHLATNYSRGLAYLASLGVKALWTFERQPEVHTGNDSPSKASLLEKPVLVESFEERFPLPTT